MRVTSRMCRIISVFDGKARIDVNESSLSDEERNKVFVLEFPKTINYLGKTFKVEVVSFINLHGLAWVTFPKLKKVRCPKDTLDSYCRWSLEGKSITVEEY